MKERRELSFSDYSEVIKEIETLHGQGYRKGGRWTLSQVCRHLSFYFRGSLEGFGFQLPWIVRVTIGRWALNEALKPGTKKPDGGTVKQSLYEPEPDDRAAVDECIELLKRLQNHRGPLYPSALFGELTIEQWQRVHLNHAAHHLGFLLRP